MGMTASDRIYVAGASGLIGSACISVLGGVGYQNVLSPSREELDLFDAEKVRLFFETNRPEYVIMAAGRVGGIVENSTRGFDMMNDNLLIQQNLFHACIEFDVRKSIFLGSSCMYPRICPQPMQEEYLLSGKPEETSLPYAISKLSGLHLGLAYNKQSGKTLFLPVIPNSAYGPFDDFDPKTSHVLSALLSRFHEAKKTGQDEVVLWGTGSPRREFIASNDIASAVLFLLEKDPSIDLPVNIGSGVDYSIRELAETIRNITGFQGRIKWDTTKPDGTPQKLLDTSRINQAGWMPKTGLEEGIRRTYAWYLDHIEKEGIS